MAEVGVSRNRLTWIVVVSVLCSIAVFELSLMLGERDETCRMLMTVPLAINLGMIGWAIFSPHERTTLLLSGTYITLLLMVPAMFHTALGIFPLFNGSYTTETIMVSTVMVLVFSVVFPAGYVWYAIRRPNEPMRFDGTLPVLSIAKTKRNIAICVGLALFVVAAVGPAYFLASRGELSGAEGVTSSPIQLILVWLARFSGFFSLLLTTVLIKYAPRARRAQLVPILIITLAVCGFVNSPINIPRFNFFGYGICILYVFLDTRKFKFKLILFLAFFFGLTTIFPLMSSLSRGNENDIGAAVGPLYYLARSGDLDGFQSIMNIYLMVQAKGLTFGSHLLSDILVFVPRALWTTKPWSTGVEAAKFVGYDYVNVSGPLPAELFVDFGWLGVALGGFAAGAFAARMDRLMEFAITSERVLLRFLPAMAVSFIIIFLRGSLLGIVAPIGLGLLSAWYWGHASAIYKPVPSPMGEPEPDNAGERGDAIRLGER